MSAIKSEEDKNERKSFGIFSSMQTSALKFRKDAAQFIDKNVLNRGGNDMQISSPYNVVHLNHVQPDNRTSTGFSVIILNIILTFLRF